MQIFRYLNDCMETIHFSKDAETGTKNKRSFITEISMDEELGTTQKILGERIR